MLQVAITFLLPSGCAGKRDDPSVHAYSEPEGMLVVRGERWHGCALVVVDLPAPWTTSRARIGREGHFSLTYPRSELKPYAGVVTVRCARSGEKATARILVNDRRAPQLCPG